jgi:hypothetical protein
VQGCTRYDAKPISTKTERTDRGAKWDGFGDWTSSRLGKIQLSFAARALGRTSDSSPNAYLKWYGRAPSQSGSFQSLAKLSD